MAIDLTAIFGTEIKVTPQPRVVQRQYHGFAGAEGLTAMFMGSRGHVIMVRGTLRAATRPLLDAAVSAIANWLWAGAADYAYFGTLFLGLVWEKMEVTTDQSGKGYHWTAEGWVTCSFAMEGRSLI